jgi:hypothetical protein
MKKKDLLMNLQDVKTAVLRKKLNVTIIEALAIVIVDINYGFKKPRIN